MPLIVSICLVFSSIFVSATAFDTDGTLVEIESGPIQGHILRSHHNKPYWAFQDIPYAAPPIGDKRFKYAVPPEPWTEVLNATANKKVCYQLRINNNDGETEDCLVINVYTPIKPGSSEHLPVLVWIHGGAHSKGSGRFQQFGPKYLIDYDVVVVTFNYRLGVFGFLTTDDSVIPPNIGWDDQLYAIKWVHRNIHLFGGNNKSVTLMGQSAGAISVGRHLIGPWVNGEELFHAVIQQSGTPLISITKAKTNPTLIALELTKKINANYTYTNTDDLLKYLQTVNAEDVAKYGIPEYSIDNLNNYNLFHLSHGNFKKVPVLIGFNSEESAFHEINDTLLAEIDNDPGLLISSNVNITDENKVIGGRLIKKLYINGSFVDNHSAYIRFSSDAVFTTAICKQAQLASANVSYYLYQFSYKGELGGKMDGSDSVGHGEDIYYLWEGPANGDISKFPEADQLTMQRMLKMWTNFVKYHDPTPEDDPLLGNVKWPTTEPNKLSYLDINGTLEVRDNPRMFKEIRPILDALIEEPFCFYNIN